MIRATSNIDSVQRKVNRIAKKMRFAESEAINQSAKFAARAQRNEAKQKFDRPTPYLLNGIFNPKTKLGFVGIFSRYSTLEAELIPGGPRGSFREGGKRINDALRLQTIGGVRTPDRRSLVIPVRATAKNKYGNLPRGKIKKLLAKPNTVQLGRREGLPPGIYERGKGGRLRMLVAYEERAQYRPAIDYYRTGQQAFRRVFKKQLDRAIAQEMKGL